MRTIYRHKRFSDSTDINKLGSNGWKIVNYNYNTGQYICNKEESVGPISDLIIKLLSEVQTDIEYDHIVSNFRNVKGLKSKLQLDPDGYVKDRLLIFCEKIESLISDSNVEFYIEALSLVKLVYSDLGDLLLDETLK